MKRIKHNILETIVKSVTLLAVFGLFLHSCSNDDDNTGTGPEILSFEYGEGSDHSDEPVAYKGSDIHLEAEIYAENTVENITLEIHSHDLTPGDGEVEWEFEQVFSDTEYQVINANFHEHVDVPENIPSGEYHIELIVEDALGNVTEADGHIEIMEAEGEEEAIEVHDIAVEASVVRGNELDLEFDIHAHHGIHNIEVHVHGHDVTAGEGETEWEFEQLFEEGYHGLEDTHFHEHIDVPANAALGDYHIEIAIEDEEGNVHEFDVEVEVLSE